MLDARLGDVIDELARYRPGVLQCDAASARLRVSGTFRLDSTDAVLANLQATLPIQVKYFTRYWVSVKSNRLIAKIIHRGVIFFLPGAALQVITTLPSGLTHLCAFLPSFASDFLTTA